jgi:hypothetical protein
LPASFARLVDVVTSRSLTLLVGNCPIWLAEAASRAEEVDATQLQPLLADNLTLVLEDGGCLRLAQFLMGWLQARRESEARQCSPN